MYIMKGLPPFSVLCQGGNWSRDRKPGQILGFYLVEELKRTLHEA